ncbi:MAG: hypothetical protein EBR30_16720 [Cytophagia bacterium]|nr:hypothetical protein [Cytophagia bacterium]NBW36627.1 hypothetical protein [Cytophagia bacterium]
MELSKKTVSSNKDKNRIPDSKYILYYEIKNSVVNRSIPVCLNSMSFSYAFLLALTPVLFKEGDDKRT